MFLSGKRTAALTWGLVIVALPLPLRSGSPSAPGTIMADPPPESSPQTIAANSPVARTYTVFPRDFDPVIGASGVWHSETRAPGGGVAKHFWHVAHDPQTRTFSATACNHRTGVEAFEALTLFRVWMPIAEWTQETDGFRVQFHGSYEPVRAIRLVRQDFLTMRGWFSKFEWRRAEGTRFSWQEQGRNSMVWERLVPVVDSARVEPSSGPRWSLTLWGRDLPVHSFMSPEFPYVIRFDDPDIRVVGSPSVTTTSTLSVTVEVPATSAPGPRTGYIMGRRFDRLLLIDRGSVNDSVGAVPGSGAPGAGAEESGTTDVGGEIYCRAFDAGTREPLSGVAVKLATEDGGFVGTDTTDDAGRCSFAGLGEGNYTLSTTLAGYEPAGAAATPGFRTVQRVQLPLVAAASARTLAGRVLDGRTDAPIPYAEVLAESQSMLADEEGRFSFTVAPGSYRLQSLVTGYESVRQDVDVPEAADPAPVTLRLPPVPLKLEVGPPFADFGVVPVNLVRPLVGSRRLTVRNASGGPLELTRIHLVGEGSDNYVILRVRRVGSPSWIDIRSWFLNESQRPTLAPYASLEVEVGLTNSGGSAAGTTLSATLEVGGRNTLGDTASAEAYLEARVGERRIGVGVELLDAISVASFVDDDTERLLMAPNRPVGEGDVAAVRVAEYRRIGFVADGNARLLVRVQLTLPGARVRLRLPSAARLGGAPWGTLAGLDGTQPSSGVLEMPMREVAGDVYQATAVLTAPDIYKERSWFQLGVCVVLPDSRDCDPMLSPPALSAHVVQAPVVLVHGLWAGPESWQGPGGMEQALSAAEYPVSSVRYTNFQGPSVTMKPNSQLLIRPILKGCIARQREGYACTRATLVGHSMGGLVSRKFIRDNQLYRNAANFHRGAVRRLLTLGTPHLGSGFANMLVWHRIDLIDNCPDMRGVGQTVIAMNTIGNKVGSAMHDLAIGSDFLDDLNESRQEVPTFAVIGDAGQDLLSDVNEFMTGCSHTQLFQGQHSDRVVSLRSARGNLSQERTLTLLQVPHVGMGTNSSMVRLVLRMIEWPTDVYSRFASLESEQGEWSYRTLAYREKEPLPGLRRQPQASPQVTLRAGATEIGPRDTVVFQAEVAGGGEILSVILTDGKGWSQEAPGPPYRWSIPGSSLPAGEHAYRALSFVDREVVLSDFVTVTVRPNLDGIRELAFRPADPLYVFSGDTESLRVFGVGLDGTMDVTGAAELSFAERSVQGLSTQEGDAPAISVSAEGTLRALAPGEAEIVATLGGHTAYRRIVVMPYSEEDADGDGVANDAEEGIGTDPYRIDTDGDGESDGDEVGDPKHPADRNGNGTADALEADVLAIADGHDGMRSLQIVGGRITSFGHLPASDLSGEDGRFHGRPVGVGAVEFTAEPAEPGGTIQVTVDLGARSGLIEGYLAYGTAAGDDGLWATWEDAVVDGSRIVLRLTDDGPGDMDPNPGVISHMGAPIVESGAGSGRIALWGALAALGALLGGALVVRRRRADG